MPVLIAAVAACAVVGAYVVLVRRHRCVRRALLKERAARRLTEAAHNRDMQAFRRRLNAAVQGQSALEEADRVLDVALAAHHHDPEGGPAL